MKNHFFHVIEEYHMIESGERVIAGVSGGADSLCLLHLLCECRGKIPFELMAVHVEHGLRGQESLDDAAFVENICEKWQIPCRVVHADVTALSLSERISCEEAGRAARYQIFEETAKEWGAQRIAVAHNQNDQAETVIWNLVRGSGLKGLGGIHPVQGKIIRPLLFSSRGEIEDYLRTEGIAWRIDRTNLEPDFTRNRIRLSLLPQMEQDLNRQSVRHIAEASGRLREVQSYLDKRTDEAAARCIFRGNYTDRETESIMEMHCGDRSYPDDASVCVMLEPYKKEEPLIQKELLKRAVEMCAGIGGQASRPDAPALKGEGERSTCSGGMRDIGAVHFSMLSGLADMDCGKSVTLPGGICAVREEGLLRFVHSLPPDADRLLALKPAGLSLFVPGAVRFGECCVTAELTEYTPELKTKILEEKKYTKWISYDTIKNNLRVRTREPGDYLTVNAGGGTKKLNDYFTDQKIPRRMRDDIPLLADGSHILWVIGWRLSEAAKVRDDTRLVLKCTYKTSKEQNIL